MHYEDYVEYADKNRWRRGVFAPDAVLEVQPKWLDMTHCPFEGLGLRCPYLGGGVRSRRLHSLLIPADTTSQKTG